jgi:high-affinity K+ transport system ATPase subunit B
MAILGKFTKQSVDVCDYDIETDDWLTDGDFVLTATSTVSPSGLTLQSTTVIEAGKVVKVWVSGGTNGVSYKIDVTMTTDDGRVKQSEFFVKIKDV